ncbi:M20 peptidase aminoacylase family protein [Cytobacillus sp. FJAT-54145]|uniref:M20 peptidase aminoacylase family protein n=1 Tax=Cytobacillus spartinae TaxID=3299023 RepID=A0ABW6K9N7_9BACI
MKIMVEQHKKSILETFRHFHEHPELSWEETKTTDYIKEVLLELGCRVRTFNDSTGVIGEIGKGKPVVALRADMDALWQEVDGVYQANHSCGHDAHMAMVLGVVEALKAMDSLPNGTVRFIFQPAEEKGTGALKFVEDGVVDDVDYLYGVHLRPIQEMPLGKASSAIIHGAARVMEGKISGEDLHGARPHLGANAIEVGATLVNMLNSIHLNSMVPYSVKMTSFHAGGKSHNIIPGNATFSLDLRAQSNEAMDQLIKKVNHQADILQNLYGINIELTTTAKIAAAVESQEAQNIMELAISDVLGAENAEAPLVTTGGDDFHFYSIKRPHLKATMLGLGCDLAPGLHHPNMTFNHDALLNGTEILTRAVLLTLEK